MRPSLRLLQLPPLPPRAKWLKTFPTSNFHIVNRLSTPLGTAVGKGKRTQVADKSLANSIVHAVGVTKDQVVLEAYPGMGFITRALLDLPPDQHPRRVITVEPAIDFNVKGLGLSSQVALDGYSLEEDHDKTTKLLLSQRMEANDRAKHALLNTRNHAMQTAMHNMFVQGDSQRMEHSDEIQSAIDPVDQPPPDVHIFRAFPSADDPTLTIIDGTMFDWKTVPQMEAQGLFSQVTRREWQDGKRSSQG
jgi:radical SAM superfamily enzyme